MPIGSKQRLITRLVEAALGQTAERPLFPWLRNKHGAAEFGAYYNNIVAIFEALGGGAESHALKGEGRLVYDAYFPEPHNFIFEFDEIQHFSSYKLQALDLYPGSLKLGFDIEHYKRLCRQHKDTADSYFKSKTTRDFPCEGGRTAQRAYLDAFRDFLPPLHGLNPTLRISEFEVEGVEGDDEQARETVRAILVSRLPSILPPHTMQRIKI